MNITRQLSNKKCLQTSKHIQRKRSYYRIKNLSIATTQDDIDDHSKTQKKKNMSKINGSKKLYEVELGEVVLDRYTKEPVHRTSIVVSM